MAQPNNQQQNRPQHQHSNLQQVSTGPGTTHTPVATEQDQLTQAEQARVSAALAIGKQQEQDEPEQLHILLAKGLYGVFTDTTTAREVKSNLQKQFMQLTPEARDELRPLIIEAGRFMLRQAEDVINDLAVTLM